MSNQLPIVMGSHAAESGKNALPHIAAYIVIGLLAFLLGVCVTVLCFRLRQMHREDGQNKESEGRHGAD